MLSFCNCWSVADLHAQGSTDGSLRFHRVLMKHAVQFVQPQQLNRQHAGAIVWGQHFGCVLVQELVHVLDRTAMPASNGLARLALDGVRNIASQSIIDAGHQIF